MNSKTSDGTGAGVFVSNLTGLNMGITYYVRSYATNSIGTAYGDQITFSTSSLQTPVLSTTAITGITTTAAITGGNVTGDNGSAVTARGVCWDIVTGPTITGMSHTVTSSTGVWDSGNIAINDVFNFPFAALGSYHYHCTYHPSMTVTIIVQ